mmetsp:Transcript_26579/g.74350  ORF Transcript_26579/g.74350 Transcript_26579/m.74350 type:complete len:262 (-) Transcript_26579:378-1163(-)
MRRLLPHQLHQHGQANHQELLQGRPHQLRQEDRRLPGLLPERGRQERRPDLRIRRVHHRHHRPLRVPVRPRQHPAEDAFGNLHPHHLQGHQHQRLPRNRLGSRNHHGRPVLVHHHLRPDPARRNGSPPPGADAPADPRSQHRNHHDRHPGLPRDRRNQRPPRRPGPLVLQHHRNHHLVPGPVDAPVAAPCRPPARKGNPRVAWIPAGVHRRDVLPRPARLLGPFVVVHPGLQGLHYLGIAGDRAALLRLGVGRILLPLQRR